MTAFGVCKGFYDSGIFASLYDSIEPSARGTAAGLMNTVGWGGGAPILYNGQVVGGVGVSGLPEEEDMALARKGASLF